MTWILWIVLTILLDTGEALTVRVPLAVFPTQHACQARQHVVEVEMATAYPDDPPSGYTCTYRPRKA